MMQSKFNTQSLFKKKFFKTDHFFQRLLNQSFFGKLNFLFNLSWGKMQLMGLSGNYIFHLLLCKLNKQNTGSLSLITAQNALTIGSEKILERFPLRDNERVPYV